MSNQYESNRVWRPVNYNPGFTTEDWVALLQDASVFTPKSLDVIKRIKELGGVATCVELSNAYGETPNFYNNAAWQLGKRIHKNTGCPLCQEKDYKYWPILFLGRHVNSKRLGTYEWKLRDELSEALTLIDLNDAPLYETFPLEEKEVTASSVMSLSDLKRAAIHYSQLHPVVQEVTRQQFQRSDSIKRYVKARANGCCQLCGENAPFCDADGVPYLEVHHIIWLSRGGSDTLDNVAALCPNCHRKMHIVQSQADIEKLKESALALIGEEGVKADSSTN